MRAVLRLLVLLAIAGCGSSAPMPDGGQGGGGQSGGGNTGGGHATGGGAGGGHVDAGAALGADCAHPIPLTAGVPGVGEVDAAGKQVHFAIGVDAGQYLDISTNANPSDTHGALDTAVTVISGDGRTVLASVDDAYPRLSTDSELYFRAPADETLCIRVEDYSSWAGVTPVAHPGELFQLTVLPLVATVPQNNLDTEPNDDADAGQPGQFKLFLNSSGGFALLYGGLDTPTDVDVYRFGVPSASPQLTVAVPPLGDPWGVGVNTYGSTLQRFGVRVTQLDGTVIGALAPPLGAVEKTSTAIGVPVVPGDSYLVWVDRPAGLSPGADDFYATLIDFVDDNPSELEMSGQSTNDTIGGAETLALSNSFAHPELYDGYLLGRLTSGDVDLFAVTAQSGGTFSISCGAERAGSGLRSTTFAVVTADATLQTETETDSADVLWLDGQGASMPPLQLPDAGTYYLKVSAAAQDSVNTGNYYRCGVHLAP